MKKYDRELDLLILDKKSMTEIIRKTGCSRRTFFSRKISLVGYDRIPMHSREWNEVQAYYDSGHTVKECCEKFNFATCIWTIAIRKGFIIPNPKRSWGRVPDESLFVRNSKHKRYTAKRRLIEQGVPYICALCGCGPIWKDKPLVLILDHENGVNNDHRRENLRFLCPNVKKKKIYNSIPE
jgi:hypothetical protein